MELTETSKAKVCNGQTMESTHTTLASSLDAMIKNLDTTSNINCDQHHQKELSSMKVIGSVQEREVPRNRSLF